MTEPTAMPGWQPIETAPRDGQRFLFATLTGFVGIGMFIGKTPVFGADSFGGGRDTTPTHWQPTPLPPATPESRCLNAPTLSATERALEIARGTLLRLKEREMMRKRSDPNSLAIAINALDKIDTLVPARGGKE